MLFQLYSFYMKYNAAKICALKFAGIEIIYLRFQGTLILPDITVYLHIER